MGVDGIAWGIFGYWGHCTVLMTLQGTGEIAGCWRHCRMSGYY